MPSPDADPRDLVALAAAILANPAIDPLKACAGDIAAQARRVAEFCNRAPGPPAEKAAGPAARAAIPCPFADGRELWAYLRTEGLGRPFLEWVAGNFGPPDYPDRLVSFSHAQLLEVWPRIVAHLRGTAPQLRVIPAPSPARN